MQNCHDLTATSWSTVNVVHDFFPLVGGHSISDCFACHEPGENFTGLSTDGHYRLHRSQLKLDVCAIQDDFNFHLPHTGS